MDQQRHDLGSGFRRHHLGARAPGDVVLLGPRLAHHHGIDDLQMRRIGGQGQMHLVVVELAVRRGAEMVFDVARTLDVLGLVGAALELVEDRPVRLGHHLGQDVQPAAMGHAEDDLLQTQLAAALDDLLQRRDQRLGAVEAEALGALVLDVEKLLEALGLDQLVEDRPLALVGEGDALVGALDAGLQPGLLVRVGNVGELDADGRAIGPLENVDHLADGGEFQAEHVVDEDLAVVVGFGEAVGPGRQFVVVVVGRLGDAERVELGVQMSAGTIGADQHDRPHRILRRLVDGGAGEVDADLLGLFGDRLDGTARGGLAAGRFGRAPIAIESRDEFAIGGDRPVVALPGRSFGALQNRFPVVLQPLEEIAPLARNRCRIRLVAGVQILDVVGIAAIEEGSQSEGLVRLRVACHLKRRGPR